MTDVYDFTDDMVGGLDRLHARTVSDLHGLPRRARQIEARSQNT